MYASRRSLGGVRFVYLQNENLLVEHVLELARCVCVLLVAVVDVLIRVVARREARRETRVFRAVVVARALRSALRASSFRTPRTRARARTVLRGARSAVAAPSPRARLCHATRQYSRVTFGVAGWNCRDVPRAGMSSRSSVM